MNVTLTVIVGILGLCVSVCTFFLGQKKNNTDDGRKMGEFIGEIRAKISNIEQNIKEIKEDRAGVEIAIARAIEQHEKTYHNRKD